MNEKKICFQNKWFQVVKEGKYYFIEEFNVKNGAAVLLREKNNFIFVKIFRKAINSYSIEIPRGYGEKGETPEETAIREVYEETGYKIKKENLAYLGEVYPNNGLLSSKIKIFYANIDKTDKIKKALDEVENIVKLKINKINEFIKNDLIKDAFTLSALFLYEKKIQRKKDEME